MAPVGSFVFSVPGSRCATVPATVHHELGADPAGRRVGLGRVGLVDDDLGDPVPVAQVEEDQLAVVAPAVDPAGQPRGRAGVVEPQLAAGVGAVGRGEARAVSVMAGVS